MTVRLPRDTERHVIVGTTGSGKTTMALHCLSLRSWDRMPWIALDFKHEADIAGVPGIRQIDLAAKLPRKPGLYLMRPTIAELDDGAVQDFLFRVWAHERIGLLLDEGYMIPRFDKGLRTILTQGRSKHVPLIALTQKPVWCSPQLFSESEFKTVFYLDVASDIDKICDVMPAVDPRRLPPHWSYWYQRNERELRLMRPCPPIARIYERFAARAPKGLVWI